MSKPICFGYFMDKSMECSECRYLKECYNMWKENGEPTMKDPVKIKVKKEYRLACPECDLDEYSYI